MESMLPPSARSTPTTDHAPPDSEPEPGRWPAPYRRLSLRGRRLVWFGVVLVAMLISSVIAASVVRIPYYAVSPGAIRDTAAIVVVEGVETYPPSGVVAFTTISTSQQRLTMLDFAVKWLDPDATILAEEEVLIGSDPDETRQINLQLMDISTQNSAYVALDRLGYEVVTTGTGAMVISIEEGMPAEEVLEVGDTVVAVDGQRIALAEDLVEAISTLEPGTRVSLTVEPLDSDETDERSVVLTARDDDPDAAFLGIRPSTRDITFEFPIDIRFETGNVGGPSAGLAYTLWLLELLTPGELAGGREIAATGTIARDGTVGPVGRVGTKAIAARRDGYEVFLVPADTSEDDLEAAHRHAGDALRIIEVATLDDALDALAELGGDPLPTG